MLNGFLHYFQTSSSLLTGMAKEGWITMRGWEGGYPVYAAGKA
jgi:hypothetical protein